MPVDSRHPKYDDSIRAWRRCRVAVDGEDAVKQAGTVYLPSLFGAEPDEYLGYKTRASYYNASGRTVKGLAGAVMRKPPTVEFPEQGQKKLLERLGASGENATMVCKEVLEEVIALGRCGMLVDAPSDEGGEPYVTLYYAENIVNWEEQEVGDRRQLVFVALSEIAYEQSPTDRHAWEKKERVRVLYLDDSGTYTQALYEKRNRTQPATPISKVDKKKKPTRLPTRLVDNVTSPLPGRALQVGPVTPGQEDHEWVMLPDFPIQPKMKGRGTLDYVPFVFVNPTTITAAVERSPIDDLVALNLSHYRNSADLEHGLHLTALPTPWVAGFDPKRTNLRIGSARAWATENVQAKAGMLEFTGAGLSAIADAMREKEKRMAVLGARLLEEQTLDAEAAETVKLRHAGETSVLHSIASTVGEAMTRVLRWAGKWAGYVSDEGEEKVAYDLNTDFSVGGIDPAVLTVLMQLVQGGQMSYDSFFYNLKRGELVPDDRTLENEQDLIAAGPPLPPAGQVELEGADLENAATRADITAKKQAVKLADKEAKVGLKSADMDVKLKKKELKAPLPKPPKRKK